MIVSIIRGISISITTVVVLRTPRDRHAGAELLSYTML